MTLKGISRLNAFTFEGTLCNETQIPNAFRRILLALHLCATFYSDSNGLNVQKQKYISRELWQSSYDSHISWYFLLTNK